MSRGTHVVRANMCFLLQVVRSIVSHGLVLSSFLKQRVCCKFPFATQVLLQKYLQRGQCCKYIFCSRGLVAFFCNRGLVAYIFCNTRLVAFFFFRIHFFATPVLLRKILLQHRCYCRKITVKMQSQATHGTRVTRSRRWTRGVGPTGCSQAFPILKRFMNLKTCS